MNLKEAIKRFKEEVEELNKIQNTKRDELNVYRGNIIKELADSIKKGINPEGYEEVFSELLSMEYEIDHKGYGKQLERNVLGITKYIFGEELVTTQKKVIEGKIEDIVIQKGDKEIIVEVKSYIDFSDKSPQSIKILEKHKEKINAKENKLFLVFASYQYTESAFEEWKKNDIRNWIFLQKYYDGNQSKNVWKIEEFKNYYPLTLLINKIKEY